MIGSFKSGAGTSVETGTGSAPTASGVCAPAPGLWLTDGASFVTGSESVKTAGEPPACSSGGCDPGQVLFDQTFAAEAQICSDCIAVGPTWGVYEIPGLGTFPDCTNLRIEVSCDAKWLDVPIPPVVSFHAYMNNSGMTLSSRDFTDPFGIPQLAGGPAVFDGTYQPVTMIGWLTADPYVDFAGPIATPQSLYLWVPPIAPSYTTGNFKVKNVHIRITTV